MTEIAANIKINNLNIESDISNIAIVENLVYIVSEKYKISDELYGNILIALTEAVTNAILHGNKSDKTKTVNIEYSVQTNNLFFIITDQGKGFDYNLLPDPTSPENIEKIDGRGIFLIKNLADNVMFNDSGNQIKLFFNI